MGVIYTSQSDIYRWAEGYSTTDTAPWGFEHQGLDYFFNNNSVVIAAAPGRVEFIQKRDKGEDNPNRYRVMVKIRFNYRTLVHYNFEMWTQNEDDIQNQINMLSVKVGDWVEIGQEIG